MDLIKRLKILDPNFEPKIIKGTSAQTSNEKLKTGNIVDLIKLNNRFAVIHDDNLKEQYPDNIRGSSKPIQNNIER